METKTFLWTVVRYSDSHASYLYHGRGSRRQRYVSNYYHIKDSVWFQSQEKAEKALGRLKKGPWGPSWSDGFVVGVEPTGSLLAACLAIGGPDGRG